MNKNNLKTIGIALGVVVVGIGGLVIGMNLDRNEQGRRMEQVPYEMVEEENTKEEDAVSTTTKEKEEDTALAEKTTDATIQENEYEDEILFNGNKVDVTTSGDVGEEDLEINLKTAVIIGLTHVRSQYGSMDQCAVTISKVTTSGTGSSNVAWNEVIEVDEAKRYEMKVNAQTGEVTDVVVYSKDGENAEWLLAEADADHELHKIEKMDLEAFTDIDVDITYNADVEVITGDSYGVIIQYYGDDYKIEYEIEKDTMKIRDSLARYNIDNMNQVSRNSVTIIVPKKSTFDSVTLHAVSGDIALQDATVSKLDTLTYSGDTTVQNVVLSEGKCEAYSGDINVKNVNSKGMILKTLSGDIEVNGSLTGKTSCEVASGDIQITCKGKEKEYSYDLNTSVGEIVVDEKEIDCEIANNCSYSKTNKTKNKIRATSASGDIEIAFE